MKCNQQTEDLLKKKAKSLGIGAIRRHIFICVGEQCCNAEQGLASWEYLKSEIKKMGLENQGVYRTKVGCLRLCRDGPIGVVYPDGIWYRELNPLNIKRILTEHIIGGHPVEDLLINDECCL